MIRINGVGGWASVMTVAAVSLIIGRQTIAQALGPSTAPLAPLMIRSGPNAGTTSNLRLPDWPGVGIYRTKGKTREALWFVSRDMTWLIE